MELPGSGLNSIHNTLSFSAEISAQIQAAVRTIDRNMQLYYETGNKQYQTVADQLRAQAAKVAQDDPNYSVSFIGPDGVAVTISDKTTGRTFRL